MRNTVKAVMNAVMNAVKNGNVSRANKVCVFA